MVGRVAGRPGDPVGGVAGQGGRSGPEVRGRRGRERGVGLAGEGTGRPGEEYWARTPGQPGILSSAWEDLGGLAFFSWNMEVLRILSRTQTALEFALETEAADAPETCDPQWAFLSSLVTGQTSPNLQFNAPSPVSTLNVELGSMLPALSLQPLVRENEESPCLSLPLDFAVRPQGTPAWAWIPH